MPWRPWRLKPAPRQKVCGYQDRRRSWQINSAVAPYRVGDGSFHGFVTGHVQRSIWNDRLARQGNGVRERFTADIRGVIALLGSRMEPGLKPRQREEKALATAASLVGALVLARAVNDPKLSDDILRATRNRLDA